MADGKPFRFPRACICVLCTRRTKRCVVYNCTYSNTGVMCISVCKLCYNACIYAIVRIYKIYTYIRVRCIICFKKQTTTRLSPFPRRKSRSAVGGTRAVEINRSYAILLRVLEVFFFT